MGDELLQVNGETSSTMTEQTLLTIDRLCVHFGGVKAINDLSCTFPRRAIVGLIGPNGSGKTTLINTITGMYQPDSGRIVFRGEDIGGLEPHEISRRGIGRTFQITRLFSRMTVFDNLLIAKKGQRGENLFLGVVNPPAVRTQEVEVRKMALDLLEFVGLTHLKNEKAANLSYGQQKLLEIARILMIDPDVILLDEPFAGVNPTNIEKLIKLISELNEDRGISIILVEHIMKVIMRLAKTIVVLNLGEVIATGTPDEIQRNDAAINAYLGRG